MMRILFSGTPAYGHLLPMLPLAMAAQRAGHETALVTHDSMAEAVAPLRVLAAGPSLEASFAEVLRRTGEDPRKATRPTTPAELFAGVRLDIGGDAVIERARAFAPDLIVAETPDYSGRLAAAALGVPWVAHGHGAPLDRRHTEVFDAVAAPRFARRGLTFTERRAFLDPWPDRLHPAGWTPPADRVAIRPEPYAGQDARWSASRSTSGPASGSASGQGPTPMSASAARFPGREGRPRVAVTLGTIVNDPGVLADVLRSLASADVNVIVAVHPSVDPNSLRIDRRWVHVTGFVPMRRLLTDTALLVAAAGAGTVLAALSAGVPMVLLPLGLDKPFNAERAAAVGAAEVVSAPAEIAPAVRKVLSHPTYTAHATALAHDIASMNSPDAVVRLLLR
jgi:UDP:flavonoid glycosyltransferase YjiC (YdhE family)